MWILRAYSPAMCAGSACRAVCVVVLLVFGAAIALAVWPRPRFVYTPHAHAADWTGGRARSPAQAGATAARFPDLAPGQVRNFSVHVPDEALEALQRRLAAAVMPPDTPVATVYGEDGWVGGVNTRTLRQLVARWRSGFDWRAAEARINALPQFVTQVSGLALHFVHAKAQPPPDGAPACPVHTLLLLHGWPGSVVEFLDIIPGLTACRGGGQPAFNVVAPSMPGYGWSDPALVPGMSSVEVGALYVRLMEVLGYDQYYVQGGDWGGYVGRAVAGVAPPGRVLGLHVNFMPMFPNPVIGAVAMLAPSLVLGQDAAMVTPLRDYALLVVDSSGYLHEQATRPDTIGTVLAASPVSLAAWLLEKFQAWSDCGDNVEERHSMDDLLTHITVYWTTSCITTSVRLYKETLSSPAFWALQDAAITVPLGYADFPREVTRTPELYLQNVAQAGLRYSRMRSGGHFAAVEEPAALAADLRAFVSAVEAKGTAGASATSTSDKDAL